MIFTFQHFLCDFHFSTLFYVIFTFQHFLCDFHFSTFLWDFHFKTLLCDFFFFLTDWPCYVVGQCTRSFDRSSLSSHLARDTFLKWTLANFAVRRRCKYIIVNFCDTLTPRTLRKNSTNRLCCRSQWAKMIRHKRSSINQHEISWDAWIYHGVMRAVRIMLNITLLIECEPFYCFQA